MAQRREMSKSRADSADCWAYRVVKIVVMQEPQKEDYAKKLYELELARIKREGAAGRSTVNFAKGLFLLIVFAVIVFPVLMMLLFNSPFLFLIVVSAMIGAAIHWKHRIKAFFS